MKLKWRILLWFHMRLLKRLMSRAKSVTSMKVELRCDRFKKVYGERLETGETRGLHTQEGAASYHVLGLISLLSTPDYANICV